MAEQRYQAVLAVIAEGRAVMEAASQWGVSRRTVHRWLARYEAEGLEGLPDRSHRPERCPHQMPAEIEVRVWRGVGRTATGARGGPGVGAQGGPAGAVGVSGVPVSGALRRHRPGQAPPPQGEVEALGARRADGAVADGRSGLLPARRRHLGQSADRHR